MNIEIQEEVYMELCEKCGKKIDPETPIQIDEPLICDICSDEMNTV